jgi:RND family efflux transporter MFP subunit
VDSAQLNVEWCRVTAPISGRISRKNVTAGNLINSGGTGSSNATLLTTITSLDPIYAYMDVDEQSVLKYQRLAQEKKRVSARDTRIPCFLQLANETAFPHEGVVDFVDNRVDPTTGTLRARGVFANPGGVMTPGLFGRLRVPGSEPYRTLLVPELAVQTDQNQKYVLTVDAEDTVRITPITIGSQFGALRSVTKGLNGDEHIIVNGLLKARPGGKVKPQLAPMPGADESAGTLSTTRVVEPATQPTTTTTRPAPAAAATQPVAEASAPWVIGVAARAGEVGR